MDMYVTGEPAGNWETAVGNSALTNYEVDVTGIDDMDKLEQYMQEHAGAIPYQMVNGKKVYIRFAKLPQNNTAVTIQGITSLVQGTAGYLTGYTGEGFWMRIAKSAVFDAIMSSMYLAIDAASVAPAIQAQIESSLDDFCIVDSDDIPVYVDSNGVAYVIEDAVEAMRTKLIEMGAYNSGESEGKTISPAIAPTVLFNDIDLYSLPVPYWYGNHAIMGYWIGNTSTDAQYVEFESDVDIYFFYYRRNNSDSCYTYICTNNSNLTYLRKRSVTFNSNGTTTYGAWSDVSLSTNTTKTGISYRYTNGGLITPRTVSAITQFVSTYGYGVDAIEVFDSTVGNAGVRDMAYILFYGTDVGGQGIEGLTVSDVVPMGFGDATLPLGDVVPGWALRGKDVSMPDEDNIWAKNPVLPLDVPLDDVWADGYAGDSADTYDGDLADLLKDALVDVLPDILDDIITDTVITPDDMYKIPVDDGGDSPTPLPPVLEGTGNGLWGIYNPELSEVNEFGAWLWSSNILDQITRMFASPIDAVIAFHVIYCTPQVGAKENIMCGFLDSGVDANSITSQYVDIPCGTIPIPEYYGTALDYDYTKIALYLPFIGFVNLSANVCMGSNISVLYRVDVLTGTCLAQVSVIKPNTNAVMYTFVGNCAVQLPLTATTYTGTVGALMGLATSFVGSEIGSFSMFTRGIAQVGQSIGESLGTGGVRQSGAISSNAGALGPRKPYLIVTRPVAYDAFEYNHQYGYPVNKTIALSSVSGYTKVKSIHLAGIPCTDDELELIENLLKEGVIFN